MERYSFPFRVGRKQKRAILDANGIEVVVFPKGSEEIADLTCRLYNQWYEDLVKAWEGFPIED